MKSTRVLGFIGATSLAVLGGAVWFFARFIPEVTKTLTSLFRATTYACATVFAGRAPQQFLVALLGGTAVFVLIGLFIFALFRRKYIFRTPSTVQASLHMTEALTQDVRIVDGAQPFARTIGLRHPRIEISTAAITQLSSAELSAVLQHEQHHLQLREPLRRFLLGWALLWVPVRAFRQRVAAAYVTASELEADAAVDDQRALSSAILHFAHVPSPARSAGFSPLAARVERLLDAAYQPTLGSIRTYIVTGLLVAGALSLGATQVMAKVFNPHVVASAVAQVEMCRQEHERQLQSTDPLRTCDRQSTTKSCAP